LTSLDEDRKDREGMEEGPADTTILLQIRRLGPLLGTASSADGAGMVFVGWMELIEVVTKLLDAGGPSLARYEGLDH
jgi:hypothetical protein